MRRLLFFIPLLFLASCEQNDCTSTASEWASWMEPSDKLKVLSTTAMIGEMVREIGGEYVDEQVLIQGQLDPHSYQLVKGDDEKLAVADLIFYNGLGLEHGPSLFYHLQSSEKAISLGDALAEENSDLILYIDGQSDPHIWMDISLWSRLIPSVVQGLTKLNSENGEFFQRRGAEYRKKLLDEHNRLLKKIQTVPAEKRYLITSHDAFNYFTRVYLRVPGEENWDVRFAAPEGLSPDSQLSSVDIKEVIDYAFEHHVTILFTETNVSPASLQKILSAGREKGLTLAIANPPLYGDAMGCPGSPGETYLGMIRWNIETLIANWGEKKDE